MATCIFCRQCLDVVGTSQEHVVPQAMGGRGWFTTPRVCPACNNLLGTLVDSVAGSDVVRLLRAEAGLSNDLNLVAEIRTKKAQPNADSQSS